MPAKTQKSSPSNAGDGANATPPSVLSDPITDAGQAIAAAAAAWQQEVASFMSRRWQRNLECCEEMWGCDEPQKAVDVQYRYAHRAAEDYMDETHRLIDIATRMGEQGLNVLQSSTRHAMEQMTREK